MNKPALGSFFLMPCLFAALSPAVKAHRRQRARFACSVQLPDAADDAER